MGGGKRPREEEVTHPRLHRSSLMQWESIQISALLGQCSCPHENGDFLRDVLDSLQRSSALTFPLCLHQGKCLPCKGEIRSRVVLACFTRCFHDSAFAFPEFSLRLCCSCSHMSAASAGERHPGKGFTWVGVQKGHVSPTSSGCWFHLI